ncbi:MAG: sodium:solute symporter family transporter, partial [Alcaligenes sp.]
LAMFAPLASRIKRLMPQGYSSGEFIHSNIWWQRVYASSERTASRSFVLAGLIWFAVPIVAGSLAFIAISQKYSTPQVNMIFPVVVSQIMGAGGAVLVLVIIYAALASTVSSLLTGAAGLIVNDIYRGVINPQATDVTVQRYAIIALAALTSAIAWNPYESMYLVLLLTGPAVAAMIWPIVFGIYTRETNQGSAFWAMLLGTLAGLAAYFWISPYAAAIVSAVLSGLVVYLSTLMNPNRAFQWRQLDHEPASR